MNWQKAQIAEWILSQALPPDRAASTVGDWMEDASERGNFWFWSCVFRTTVSSIWSDLVQSPATMARWGLTGFSLNMLVPLGSLALMLFLIGASRDYNVDLRYRHDWVFTYLITYAVKKPDLPGDLEFTWPLQSVIHVFWALRLFQTGRWIARKAPGREVAGCLAIILTGWLTILAEELWWAYGNSLFRPRPVPSVLPMGIAHDVILVAGALWLRRRQIQPATR